MDVESSIYELPLALQREEMDDLVVERLGLDAPQIEHSVWVDIVRRLKSPSERVDIGVVGKYIELQDAYKSVYESLTHGGIANDCAVNVVRIDAEALEVPDGVNKLKGLNGILVPGGFGDRGIEGKIAAVKFARENKIPYLGLCLGLQIAVVEFARNVLGLEKANSYEVDENSPDPVISMMNEQKNIVDKGATMRLGSYECKVKPGTKGFAAYGQEFIRERHRHRYEVNNDYVERLEAAGLTVSGVNPKRDLVEMVELEDHPWFLAVQSHPEFLSKPSKAHPLFQAFVSASLEEKRV